MTHPIDHHEPRHAGSCTSPAPAGRDQPSPTESASTGAHDSSRLTVAEAAARLGVEAAAVPVFIRLGLLRAIAGEPPMVWTCDVERLRDELLRRGGSMHDRGGAIGYQ